MGKIGKKCKIVFLDFATYKNLYKLQESANFMKVKTTVQLNSVFTGIDTSLLTNEVYIIFCILTKKFKHF